MKKIRFVSIFTFACLCMVLSCNKKPFSNSTDIGREIVEDFDPSITNVDKQLKLFTGSAKTDSAFSMRDSGDVILPWLQRKISALAAGTFSGTMIDGVQYADSAFTYIEFRPGVLLHSENENKRNKLKSAFSIDSLFFVFNRLRMTIDSANRQSASARIDVFSCDTFIDSASIAFDRKKIHDSAGALGTFSISLDSIAPDTVYSVKLDSATYALRIRKAVKDLIAAEGPRDTSWFAFCLKPSPNSRGVVRIYNQNTDLQPRIVAYYRDSLHDTTIKTETLYCDHASYSVFESDSAAACRHPFTSWQTGRRAVFKLNVSSLREFMDTAAGAGKKYVNIMRANLKLHFGKGVMDLQNDSVLVEFCMSDTLSRTGNDFYTTSTFYFKNTAADTGYSLSVANWLWNAIVQKKSNTVYLYLMTPAWYHVFSPTFIQIDWTQPSFQWECNAIVSSPR